MAKILAAAITAVALAAGSACAKPAQPDAVIPLDMSGPRPMATLTIGEHPPQPVIFDSGAGASVVSTALARKADLPNLGMAHVGSPGGASTTKAILTSISGARLGDAAITNGQAVIMDFPARLGDVRGVVSPNAFNGRLVRFEFSKGRAVVTDRTPASIPQGEAFSYGGDGPNRLPAVIADVAGVRIPAHLDSGSRLGLTLPMADAGRLPLKGPLVSRDPVRRIGGDHRSYTATVAGTVRVGPLTLTDPEVVFAEGVPIANIGMRILKDVTLVLDPEGRRDWLLPSG